MILKIRVCHHTGWMRVRMEHLEILTPEGITEFLSGSAGIDFTEQIRTERYAWLRSTLQEQRYFSLDKKQRGAVRALLAKVSGLSLPQITRLIRAYRESGEIRVREGSRRRFPTKYTEEDMKRLMEVDRAHQRLSGPATRRIMERAWQVCGKKAYARRAEISGAHLYNLPHQLRRRRNPVGDSRLCSTDQRTALAPGAGGHAPAVPFLGFTRTTVPSSSPPPWLSCSTNCW
jgi:transposase